MNKLILTVLSLFIWIISVQAQKDTASIYFEKANHFFDKKEYKTAILYCDSTIVYNSEHQEAYAFRGVCKFKLKQFNAAIEDFNLAIILVPGYAEVYYFRGFCHMELGKKQSACEDWEEAYNLGLKKAMKLIVKHCELKEEE
jgi:tetratricopeptide (TPR) repeat protein